jgi:4-phospho-D-threonate 3-dehydrogenase / 4-phospho-D-erythronate 3-dehydrogenase
MNGWLGITLGDRTGIGPEVTLKALAARPETDPTRFLLIGDSGNLRLLNQQLPRPLDLRPFEGFDRPGRCFVTDPLPVPLAPHLPPGHPAAAAAALSALEEGAKLCLHGQLDALVTAPVNKEAILRTGRAFVGQTEFLSELAHTPRTAMMLLGADDRGRWLRVALATTHVPIRRVAEEVTQPRIERAIELAAQACRDLDLPRARVAVCGLNPHAGEGGQLGTEEQTTIVPAVEAARRQGCDVVGPLAADTLFYQAYRGDFDAVVAMYHDQGLGPLKMIGFETGVNWTLGLPFIRTSPDHGTAYDLVGRGVADPASMAAAIGLAQRLAGRRR